MSAAVERVAKPKRTAKPKVNGKPIPAWALATMSGDITAEWKLRGGGAWRPTDRAQAIDPREDRPAVIVFDIGSNGACFHLGWGVGWSSEILTQASPGYPDRIRDLMYEARSSASACLVVVEDTNAGFARVRPESTLKIARDIGAVVFAARLARLPVLRVPAYTWQLAMLTPDRKRLSRADGKAASRALATSHFGAAITSEDVADAACLALWARGGRP